LRAGSDRVEHDELRHIEHAPVHDVSLSALQRGQRISLDGESRPHDGQGVTRAI